MNKPVEEEPGLQPYTGRLGGFLCGEGACYQTAYVRLQENTIQGTRCLFIYSYNFSQIQWYKHI